MVNKCIFIGNMGRAAEIKKTESGHIVTAFSIVCTDKWKKKGTDEMVETTEWVNIVAWDGLAENVQKYTSKGSRIYVEGKLHTRSYEDNQGIKRYVSEIWAKEIRVLDSRKESAPTPASPDDITASAEEPAPAPKLADDDLPF